MSTSYLPPKLRDFSIRELFLFTGIPLHLLEGFQEGKFKPAVRDREKLSDMARPFYKFSHKMILAYVDRKKYRALSGIISISEKDELLRQKSTTEYRKKLNEFLLKYWDQVAAKVHGGWR